VTSAMKVGLVAARCGVAGFARRGALRPPLRVIGATVWLCGAGALLAAVVWVGVGALAEVVVVGVEAAGWASAAGASVVAVEAVGSLRGSGVVDVGGVVVVPLPLAFPLPLPLAFPLPLPLAFPFPLPFPLLPPPGLTVTEGRPPPRWILTTMLGGRPFAAPPGTSTGGVGIVVVPAPGMSTVMSARAEPTANPARARTMNPIANLLART